MNSPILLPERRMFLATAGLGDALALPGRPRRGRREAPRTSDQRFDAVRSSSSFAPPKAPLASMLRARFVKPLGTRAFRADQAPDLHNEKGVAIPTGDALSSLTSECYRSCSTSPRSSSVGRSVAPEPSSPDSSGLRSASLSLPLYSSRLVSSGLDSVSLWSPHGTPFVSFGSGPSMIMLRLKMTGVTRYASRGSGGLDGVAVPSPDRHRSLTTADRPGWR